MPIYERNFKMRQSLRDFWNKLKLFDRNLLIYWLILVFLIILFRQNLHNWGYHLALLAGIIGIFCFAINWLDNQTHRILQFIRRWYIIGALPFLYGQVKPLLHLVTMREYDPVIIKFDIWLFGELPNIWVQQYVEPWLTEIMQISYSIYWMTIPLGGAILYFNKKYKLYDQMMHFVTITFFFSYLFFIFFPVAGPRFYIADQIQIPYQGVLFGNTLRQFVTEVGYRGGAFPSSHVGVAVVVLFIIWRYKPKVGIFVFLPMIIALSLATVYGQYHYLGDVWAGLLMGIIIGTWGKYKIAKELNDT